MSRTLKITIGMSFYVAIVMPILVARYNWSGLVSYFFGVVGGAAALGWWYVYDDERTPNADDDG